MVATRQSVADELALRPTTFTVGTHTIVLAKTAVVGRWTLSVDGRRAEETFESEVDAWEQGVRTADALDRPAVPR